MCGRGSCRRAVTLIALIGGVPGLRGLGTVGWTVSEPGSGSTAASFSVVATGIVAFRPMDI